MAEDNKQEKNKNEDITAEIARINQYGSITVAKITVIGTVFVAVVSIVVALINVNSLPLQSETTPTLVSTLALTPSLIVLPTETATLLPPAISVTSTFIVTPTKTDTPVPTEVPPLTPTIHPTSIPGQDWGSDCIDLYTWQPYLDSNGSAATMKCSQLAIWGITAQDGELFLSSFESQSTAKEYGLITKLPTRTTIEIDIEVERLKNSEVWVGIFDADRSEQFSGVVFVTPRIFSKI